MMIFCMAEVELKPRANCTNIAGRAHESQLGVPLSTWGVWLCGSSVAHLSSRVPPLLTNSYHHFIHTPPPPPI